MAVEPRVIPNTVDVHFRWVGPQQQACENVYQFKYFAIPTSAQCDALAADVAASLLPRYQAFMTTQHTFNEVYVKDIGAATDRAIGTYRFPSGTHGNDTGDPTASNVACNVFLRTLKSGRTNKGAKRLSGFSENLITKDTFWNEMIALIAELAVRWLISYGSGGNSWTPVVASDKANTANPILQIGVTDYVVDSQKTRLLKHGR